MQQSTAEPPQPVHGKKLKNAVERFWSEHQEEYEARERRGDRRLDDVERHAKMHPELTERLIKRREDGKPVAGLAQCRAQPPDPSEGQGSAPAQGGRGGRSTVASTVPRGGGRCAGAATKPKPTRKKRNAKRPAKRQATRSHSTSSTSSYSVKLVPMEQGPSEWRGYHVYCINKRRRLSRPVSVDKVSMCSMSSYRSFGSIGQPPKV